MGNTTVTQAVIVNKDHLSPHQLTQKLALFDANGDPIEILTSAETADNIPLTGYVVGDPEALDAADTVSEAFGKVQKNLTDLAAGKIAFAAVTTATAIGTAAKTTTAVEPAANSIVPVKFTNGNSANTPTLAFNGGTARAMQLGGTASAAAKITVAANGVVLFWFDGTVLHQMGVVS